VSRCPAWHEFVIGRVQDGNCECYVVRRASGAGSKRAALLAGVC
jgi:hypothetical protein